MNEKITRIFESKKTIFIISVVLVIITIILTCVLSHYVYQKTKDIDVERNDYLIEINNRVVTLIETRLKSSNSILSALSAILDNFDNLYDEEVFDLLIEECEINGFSRMAIALPDGTYKTTNGFNSNIKHREYFQNAMKGESTISDMLISVVSNKPIITIATPIYRNSKVIGVLVGTHEYETLANLLSVKAFKNQGYMRIIDRNGKYIFSSSTDEDSLLIETLENEIFDIDKKNEMYVAMTKRFPYVCNFEKDDEKQIMIYSPIMYNDWSLLTVIPESFTKRSQWYNILIMILCFFSIFVLVAFLLYFSFFQMRNRNELKRLAYNDPLTDGGNFNWFLEEAKKMIDKLPVRAYAIVTVNMDKFKVLNDVYGHKQGDKVLVYVYKNICKILDIGELVARVNSDHFIMLLKYHTINVIQNRLELLTIEINEFNNKLDKKFFLSFSYGICQIDEKYTDLLNFSDRATMSLQGSNVIKGQNCRFGFFNEWDRAKMVREKTLENKMEKALDEKEFLLYLQPKYDISKNQIVGAESLVRWNDKENGLIYPSEFIPIFEKNGFILNLDLYMFESTCKVIRQWLDLNLEPVVISVNLSRAYLSDLNFLDMFESVREKYNVPAKYLELELTESIVYENMNLLIEVINSIHNLGFSCSLDDFGSGYSSLNILKNVPVDVIKLDKGFFSNVEKDSERGNTVVSSVIDLAKKLNMKTVSEGVEKDDQVDFLRNAQCDMIQGFVFYKPMPVAEFEKTVYGLTISEKAVLKPIDENAEGEFLMHDATD